MSLMLLTADTSFESCSQLTRSPYHECYLVASRRYFWNFREVYATAIEATTLDDVRAFYSEFIVPGGAGRRKVRCCYAPFLNMISCESFSPLMTRSSF